MYLRLQKPLPQSASETVLSKDKGENILSLHIAFSINVSRPRSRQMLRDYLDEEGQLRKGKLSIRASLPVCMLLNAIAL